MYYNTVEYYKSTHNEYREGEYGLNNEEIERRYELLC